jgi:hypothetical protein
MTDESLALDFFDYLEEFDNSSKLMILFCPNFLLSNKLFGREAPLSLLFSFIGMFRDAEAKFCEQSSD